LTGWNLNRLVLNHHYNWQASAIRFFNTKQIKGRRVLDLDPLMHLFTRGKVRINIVFMSLKVHRLEILPPIFWYITSGMP